MATIIHVCSDCNSAEHVTDQGCTVHPNAEILSVSEEVCGKEATAPFRAPFRCALPAGHEGEHHG